MANIKTAISIQPTLFEQVDALARELRVSRSRVFTLAVEEFIQRHDNQKLLEDINAAYDDDSSDPEEQTVLQKMRSHHTKLVHGEW